ncbi:glycosyltransferase family 4 protein [Actinocrinis puniceicyclus]|uniref:phosphatidyl-myo-inositol dimannoside synthase n=1 Tax=Actinocrinis puniceicyclus TaxID=977794 RepID=A0A8J7WRE0_9ACTN|nr:glycosyltransferase family 4 protein [Actinocrinis puniceicyclus]MBS2964607.1 glycosyltransferase family 4 protein [Actinocrinis puniceicyclus]
MPRTLVVTNDYPPRPGGIQEFVQSMVDGFTPSDVVVYASTWRGKAAECRAYDAQRPYLTVREDTSVLLPDPRRTRRACEIARAEGCETVWFGAAAPLGLMAPALRRAGVGRLVATTHGHETGWAQLPGARTLLRRIGDGVDVITYLSEYQRTRIGAVLSPQAAARMQQLSPGVDTDRFRPELRTSPEVAQLRELHGLTDRPVAVCVSRLVPRKGQDTLIRAWPAVKRAVPDAMLLIGGGGPYRKDLERIARETGVERDVLFAGRLPWEDLPLYYAAGDVFAMPCRTRRAGLDVEGLGIVYLEASATGLPVLAGDSGGAPDAVIEGETGFVVPGRDVDRTARGVARLLADPALAVKLGEAGRCWVERRWQWSSIRERFRALLDAR